MARLSIAALAALFMLACDAPPPPSTTPVSRAAEAPTDLTTARPKKGAVIGGELVDRTIAWPDAGAIDPALRDRLEASARDRDRTAAQALLANTAEDRLEVLRS